MQWLLVVLLLVGCVICNNKPLSLPLLWLCLLMVLWYILSIKCSTQHGGRLETLLFTEGPARQNTLTRFRGLMQCFHIFIDLILYFFDQPHTLLWQSTSYFTLSLFQSWRDICFPNANPLEIFHFKMQCKSENKILSKSKFLSSSKVICLTAGLLWHPSAILLYPQLFSFVHKCQSWYHLPL